MQLKEFYKIMEQTKRLKTTITRKYLNNKTVAEETARLRELYKKLKTIPKRKGSYVVETNGALLPLDISYELTELEKDLIFLEKGEEAFLKHLSKIHKNFDAQVKKGLKRFKMITFNNFITDRDGTINNYCGRYASSVQSVYNAVFISEFVKTKTTHAVIVTSAPLDGLLKLNVNPKQTFIYAGSKGREYQAKNGSIKTARTTKTEEALLENVEQKILALLKLPEFERHAFIGSGFQRKFGQITVARQDIGSSISKEDSKRFLQEVEGIVTELDPKQTYLEIEDTGLDIEIILKKGKSAFSKGDGVNFLEQQLHLKLKNDINLVCGDTSSDVALAEATLKHNKNTEVVFVTTKNKLKMQIKAIKNDALFVTTPDVLITIFYKLAHL